MNFHSLRHNNNIETKKNRTTEESKEDQNTNILGMFAVQ